MAAVSELYSQEDKLLQNFEVLGWILNFRDRKHYPTVRRIFDLLLILNEHIKSSKPFTKIVLYSPNLFRLNNNRIQAPF